METRADQLGQVDTNLSSTTDGSIDRNEFKDRLQLVIKLDFGGKKWLFRRACNVASDSQLRRYLNGQGFPAWPVLVALSSYGINLNWLVDGKGSRRCDSPSERKSTRFSESKRKPILSISSDISHSS